MALKETITLKGKVILGAGYVYAPYIPTIKIVKISKKLEWENKFEKFYDKLKKK